MRQVVMDHVQFVSYSVSTYQGPWGMVNQRTSKMVEFHPSVFHFPNLSTFETVDYKVQRNLLDLYIKQVIINHHLLDTS